MSKLRLTYIQQELLEKTSWINDKPISTINNLSMIRSKSDYTLINTIKILWPLVRQRQNFHDLQYKSGIRMKKSFFKYAKFCIDLGFLERTEKKIGTVTFYNITPKGLEFLRLVQVG